jgi:hypothetical protein
MTRLAVLYNECVAMLYDDVSRSNVDIADHLKHVKSSSEGGAVVCLQLHGRIG